MSNSSDRERRSVRLYKSRVKGIKRYKESKAIDPLGVSGPITRRFEDRSWFTCGNSNCVMCGNPRKFFSELTLKEKSDIEVTKLEDHEIRCDRNTIWDE